MQYYRRKLLMLLAAVSLCSAGLTAQAADKVYVTLKTNMGNIALELYPDKAPKTVDNFLAYVKNGHYNGTIFHRVINGFMIQGGGFDKDMNERPTNAPIENEGKNGLKNDLYTIAMARMSDPNSATAQFFINVNNNAPLNYPNPDGSGYCVFGKVVGGTQIVDKIKQVETGNHGMYQNVPLKPIIIESASISK